MLFDTNGLKASNIQRAAVERCGPAVAARFVEYFVRHNGVPRETKIAAFFDAPADREVILARYNALNAATLSEARMLPEARAFLDRLSERPASLYVLSGGSEGEVRALLDRAAMLDRFRAVCGGPTSKRDHLRALALDGAVCYFGDSLHDYDVAAEFGFDFVFLTRYSQFDAWAEFFADKPDVVVALDFSALQLMEECSA